MPDSRLLSKFSGTLTEVFCNLKIRHGFTCQILVMVGTASVFNREEEEEEEEEGEGEKEGGEEEEEEGGGKEGG